MSIKKVNNPSFIKKYEQIKSKAVRVVGGGGADAALELDSKTCR